MPVLLRTPDGSMADDPFDARRPLGWPTPLLLLNRIDAINGNHHAQSGKHGRPGNFLGPFRLAQLI